MIHFVGAGSGAPDLITVRGQKFLREADVVIYAGSLVNPELLKETKPGCEILNSAYMTLDEVIRAMEKAEREGKMTVRLHTGDPAIYGAIREQMDRRESFRSLAAHHATMAVFLSTGLLSQMEKELAEAGYESDTPAVIIYKATWPEEKIVRCTVSTLAKSAEENGIKKTAMIFIGDVFGTREANGYEESRLYAPDFSTEFRKGTDI